MRSTGSREPRESREASAVSPFSIAVKTFSMRFGSRRNQRPLHQMHRSSTTVSATIETTRIGHITGPPLRNWSINQLLPKTPAGFSGLAATAGEGLVAAAAAGLVAPTAPGLGTAPGAPGWPAAGGWPAAPGSPGGGGGCCPGGKFVAGGCCPGAAGCCAAAAGFVGACAPVAGGACCAAGGACPSETNANAREQRQGVGRVFIVEARV